MSLIEKTGDLFTASTAAIGHGVNCRGLMGAGIAKEFRRRWPDMYSEYRKLCEERLLKPGQIYPYRFAIDPTEVPAPWFVINIASQEYPGPDASYEWLDSGICNALAYCRERGIVSLAIPRIGCGIGGLTWELVRDLLEVASVAYGDTTTLEVWSP